MDRFVGSFLGDIAGRGAIFEKGGYLFIREQSKVYKLSRYHYMHVHGPIPPWLVVDHINRNKRDDRIENLRLVSIKKNNENRLGPQVNNKLGLKGVCTLAKSKKFRAQIKNNGKKIHLGVFDTPLEAYAAYCKAAREFHTCNPHAFVTE